MTYQSMPQQANNAGIDAELLEADSGSDMDEDAEAKLARLRQAAQASKPHSSDSTPTAAPALSQKQIRGRKARQKAETTGDEKLQEEKWQGMIAATEGPTSVYTESPHTLLNGSNTDPTPTSETKFADQSVHQAQNGGPARQSAVQIILQSRAEALSPQVRKEARHVGPQSNRKRKQVSIGPLLQTAAEGKRDTEDSMSAFEGEQPAGAAFIKSKTFGGEKLGYRFGKGKQGLGYYLEAGTGVEIKTNAKRWKSEAAGMEEGTEVDAIVEELATDSAAAAGGNAAALGKAVIMMQLLCLLFLFLS